MDVTARSCGRPPESERVEGPQRRPGPSPLFSVGPQFDDGRVHVLVGSVVDANGHVTPLGHPERHARLVSFENGIADAHLDDVIRAVDVTPAPFADLARVHDELYLDALAQLCGAGGGRLDPDTIASSGSFETARQAAGLGLAAVAQLRAGRAASAFVAPRPPGHHAVADRAMGFCLVNNIAVTAAALADDGERVAILDWDVHHGNGTQAIFWDDPRVLYASVHQWPAYPGTGRAEDCGGPKAPGLTVNVPLPAGATGDVALAALDEVVTPAIDAFVPTWVLISAGFDAHRHDPLGELAWSAGDFAMLTRRAVAWAPAEGRVVAVLEGGYDLDALRACVHATVRALAGEPAYPEPITNGGPGRDAIERAKRARHGGR